MPRGLGAKTDGTARAAQEQAKRGTGPAASLVDWVTGIQGRVQSIEDKFFEMGFDMKRIAQSEVKKRWKIQPQAETYFGLYIALCIDTLDPYKQGRVRMYSPLLNNPNTKVKALDWAYPISSLSGFDDSGSPWVPPASSMMCVMFERGSRSTPYYLGTTWPRDRGPTGAHTWDYTIPEYYCIWEGHRKGYLVGPNDESQVLPPWNTENYNGPDVNKEMTGLEIEKLPIHPPHIYGFKTPEKHMWKGVDGDPWCNRRWKRLEILSGGGGGWMMFKDDHMHPSGQWAHPDCGCNGCGGGDLSDCASCDDPFVDCCSSKEDTSCDAGWKGECSNPWFKHQNECRPYKGPGTPQNNRADLPQTGIQFLSYGGHTFVMDDKVEEPEGIPNWERSLQPMNFGCTNKCEGRTHWTSMTGHFVEFSDWEDAGSANQPGPRSVYNHVKVQSACGLQMKMCDHTLPECIAGENRGIWFTSTSNHVIQMCDDGTPHCSPRREIDPETSCQQGLEPGKREPKPNPDAKRGYIRLRTGYGLEIMMADFYSQKNTDQQYIQIFCPHKDNPCGPHIMRFQERPNTCDAYVYLRVAGEYLCSTCCDHYTIVGDESFIPANKLVFVTKDYIEITKDVYYNAARLHLFFAEEHIFLLVDHDCPENSPCAGLVAVLTSAGLKASTRVIASFRPDDPTVSVFHLHPFMSNSNE